MRVRRAIAKVEAQPVALGAAEGPPRHLAVVGPGREEHPRRNLHVLVDGVDVPLAQGLAAVERAYPAIVKIVEILRWVEDRGVHVADGQGIQVGAVIVGRVAGLRRVLGMGGLDLAEGGDACQPGRADRPGPQEGAACEGFRSCGLLHFRRQIPGRSRLCPKRGWGCRPSRLRGRAPARQRASARPRSRWHSGRCPARPGSAAGPGHRRGPAPPAHCGPRPPG